MLSLERRDARKELGVGGGGREMMMMEEDTELEEGEACSYHSPNNDDDDDDCDATMDPDVALSYLDEKLQHVLGHFQKDFEGGVSAENLGAKFGGYGSFLSSQRSPAWSHPRTPPNVQQTSNLPKSPNTLQYGAGRRSSDSSGAPQAIRPGHTSAGALSLPSTKMPSLTVASLKQERRMPSAHMPEEVIGREILTKKPDSLPDPKMLKFRIKVGSDNLSTQTNDALYSGLGLNVSPSSSMEDSPSESEEMSHDLHHASLESPAHIIRIMTSFPVHGGLLLSPLPDFLIHLMEKERLPRDSGSIPVSNLGKKMLGQGKMKLLERCELSSESKNDYKKVSESGIEIASSKEMVLDSLACDRLVSHTLRLPLLSSAYSTTGETIKGSGMASNLSKEVCKDGLKDNAVIDPEKVPFIPMASQEDGCIVNSIATTLCEDLEDKKDESLDSASECSRKGGPRRRGKSSNSVKIDANISKVGKALRAESTESIKHKTDQKFSSQKYEGEKFISSKECLPSEGKKKPKKSQNHSNVVAEISKTGSIDGPYSASRIPKDSHVNDSTEGELEDLKVQKTVGKSGDRYRDFFGDMELEHEDSHPSPSETSHVDRVKAAHVVHKETNGIGKSLVERLNGKKNDKMLASEVYSKPGSSAALHPQNVSADPAPVSTDPVVTEDDHWVCCDKCQTWRLLPFGKNPDDLPEKWLCEMLDWLPGMNRCGFTEEETTEALIASYRAAAPNGKSGPAGDHGGHMTKGTLRGVRTHDAIAASRQKKHALRESSNKEGLIQLPNSAKRAVATSVPNGSVSETSRSLKISEAELMKSSRSSDAAMGNNKPKLKGKHKVLDNFSDGGETRQPKMRSKRVSDEDLVRASKKLKAEDLPEDPMSDYVSEKNGPDIRSGKLRSKESDHTSSKDSKNEQKDEKKVYAKKPKDEVQIALDVRSMDRKKHKDGEVVKKRKANEDFDANVRSSSPFFTESLLHDGGIMAKEDFSDSDFRKEKKALLSRSIGKEVSNGKGDGRTEKKGSHGRKQQSRQDLGSTLSQRSLDGVECSKKDSGNRHPPVAATSSSSKVSGSHRTKGNILDTKGSPVESVSSLPIGTPKPDKLVAAARNTERHINRKCSDGEDEGFGDQFGKRKKDKNIDLGRHGSLEPCIDFKEKDYGQCLSFGKVKQQSVPTVDSTNQQIASATANSSDKDTQHHSRSESKDKHHNEERPNGNHSQSNGSRSRKSTKGSSSSRSKDRSFDTSLDNGKPRASDSTTAHAASFGVKSGDRKNKADEKIGVMSDRKESRYLDKSSGGLLLAGNGKTDARPNLGGHNCPGDDGLASNTDDAKPSLPLEGQMSSAKEKEISANPCGIIQEEKSLSVKGNVGKGLSVSASGGDKPQKQIRKVDHPPNGINHSSGNKISNGHRIRDHDAPSPVKRDSSSQAANNALKEAKNLKHLADRLKNSGSVQESTRLYFEASLKFLNGASLLESGSNENAKDMIQSMQIYTSTAKLCEFCAHEYEKSRDMAAAALAYKCMEVAYLRVIHCSHSSANRDRHELQMALQMIPTGESPSSSASDIDNLNHPTAVDKVTLGKGISSPQVTGGHIIAARNRTNVTRLLTFAQNVNFAMEASRKSRTAFAAASISLGDSQSREGITSIKTALDFSFHDVEGLLRLIRLAVEAISR
ncbi:unnamed protein product [Linum tenue]|uniref:CW-type domain-containing protein n=1 Tax=Linum tenue TaxID=586396 RepID=A0AAV0MLJ6_9ROSI|nr:unnamed protein product [Linum tenue]